MAAIEWMKRQRLLYPVGVDPVVVLGAGINGAAIARELVLNRVPVWLVDTADIAAGTTACSSRLIHGGLRYLEHGELSLVRESLAERSRLLRLAPQLVRPLRLFIPVSRRWGGFTAAVGRLLGLNRGGVSRPGRGLYLIWAGLWLYDWIAGAKGLPRHAVVRSDDPLQPRPEVDSGRYPWLCSYTDGQIAFPERFTLALVQDAAELAATQGTTFRVWTYHRPLLSGTRLSLVPTRPDSPFAEVESPSASDAEIQPSLIVNATGAWVDRTLSQLRVPSRELLQGTKGTHLFTTSSALKRKLAGHGIYAEASDGRPVFILPLASGTLVGTTDERFSGPPEDAVATPQEIEYLLGLVHQIVPGVALTVADVDWHYAGVRPLPRADRRSMAAITRRHFLVRNPDCPVPLFSVVGGKLTTCRSLAEQVTGQVLPLVGRTKVCDSRDRPFPGGEDYPEAPQLLECLRGIAERHQVRAEQVAAIWRLCGSRTEQILGSLSDPEDLVTGTLFPKSFVRRVIRQEWARTIGDLVERRLMLLFDATPGVATLRDLADLLVEKRLLSPQDREPAVQQYRERLRSHFGLR